MPAFLLVSGRAAVVAALLCAIGCASHAERPSGGDPVTGAAVPTRAPTPVAEISFEQAEPWSSAQADFRCSLDFDQPVTQEEAPAGYRPTATYAGAKQWPELVLDVLCASDTREPDAPASPGKTPLASLATVYVFGADRSAPIAVFAGADLTLQRGTANGFEMDGRGPVVSTVERVRIPFAAHQDLIRGGHPYSLTVVALDEQGRTMVCEDIDGNEADAPIEPTPLPQSGWSARMPSTAAGR